jgi:TolB-like protein
MLRKRLAFGPFLLNPESGTLLRDGEPIAVGHRGVLLLEAFLQRPGEVLTKTDLIDAAWSGIAVEESNLSVQIALLRKALGRSPVGGDWIATIPRIGYRFVGPSTEPERAGTQQLARPSLAVLPFANLSSDPEQEFFAEGLADEIITTLSKLSGLFVVARNSSFAFKDTSVDVRRVAKELGVRYVMEGSVRRSGNRVRIIAQLNDGETGGHIWAERYDRELADIFAVQDEVTRQIVEALEVALTPSEMTVLANSGTKNIEALDCFLRARSMLRGPTLNLEVYKRITGLLRQSIDADPAYAAPYAALGMAHAIDYQNRWTGDPDRSLAEGTRLADQAIERDPNDPFAHGVAALVAMHCKNFERWSAEVDAALSLNPNYPLAHALRGNLHIYSGKPLAGIADIERAMRLDPYYTQGYLHHLGVAHTVAGKYESAAALFRERILLVPETDMSRAYLATVLGHLGEIEEARKVWRELTAINPSYSFAERIGRMPFQNQADVERIMEGLKKAGLPN